MRTLIEQMGDEPMLARVREFNEAFGIDAPDAPTVPVLGQRDRNVIGHYAEKLAAYAVTLKELTAKMNGEGRLDLGRMLLRIQLHVEQVAELAQALADCDLVAALGALGDADYVTGGTYLALGVGHLRTVVADVVHESNMSKLDADGRPLIAASGRVLKGPLYTSPAEGLRALLAEDD